MSISDDVILEQVEYTFDGASNVILAVTRERSHNAVASQTGPLNDPSTTPKARVTHVAFYHDGIGRVIATADYGTNGGTVFSRSLTTPCVQYAFADGSANTVRPTSITCPNGRVLDYSYSTSGSMPDAVSRIDSIISGMQTLAQYSYLGVKKFVAASYPEPNVQWTMVNLAGTNDPDTGDIYSGFDRFGRVKDNRWYNNGTSTDVDRIKHGYDRVGSRLYRQNTVATANGAAFDELYSYDRVNRLKEMQRGTLNGTQSAILSPIFSECWSMDSTANWSGYRQGTAPGDWSLVQRRSVDQVNAIVSFTNSVGAAWATPAYDSAGNMTIHSERTIGEGLATTNRLWRNPKPRRPAYSQ